MANTIKLLLLLLFFSIIGTIITIIREYLEREKGEEGHYFSHFWFINTLMFFAETLGFLLYHIIYCRNKKIQKLELEEGQEQLEEQVEIEIKHDYKKLLLFFIPSFLDIVDTSISNIGIILLPGNTYMMFKGFSIILIICLISKFILKNNHTWDHYISIGIAMIGFALSVLSYFYGQQSENQIDKTSLEFIAGLIAVLISTIFQSIQFCLEEYFMRKYSLHPFLCIGFEGVFGFIFNLILCIGFYFIKCDMNFGDLINDLCTKDENNWRVENVLFAFQQMHEDFIILILIIVLFFFLFLFNVLGISINKYGGALTRSLIDNIRNFFVWLSFAIFPFPDQLKEKFNWLRLIGLIFILVSLVIYFGVFRIQERLLIKKKINSLSKMDDLNEGTDDFSKNESENNSDYY